jgi:uncharacterized membrane protein YqjE
MRELRRLFATLLQVVRLRFELASVELDEQVAYAANLLIWILVALFCASLGAMFLGLSIIVICWDQHRILAATGVTTGYVLLAVIATRVVHARLQQRPRFLAATMAELQRDAGDLKADE